MKKERVQSDLLSIDPKLELTWFKMENDGYKIKVSKKEYDEFVLARSVTICEIKSYNEFLRDLSRELRG